MKEIHPSLIDINERLWNLENGISQKERMIKTINDEFLDLCIFDSDILSTRTFHVLRNGYGLRYDSKISDLITKGITVKGFMSCRMGGKKGLREVQELFKSAGLELPI